MYKAVFLDMDGTLLKSDHSVSEATKDSIRQIIKKGIPVVLVSARPLNAVLPTWRDIGLEDFPIVTLNGSYIVQDDEPIFDAMIDLPLAEAVAEQVKPFSANIAYYIQREWFAEVNDAWTQHEQKIMDIPIRIEPLPELVKEWSARKVGPNKMMVMGEPETIAVIQDRLKAIYNGQLNIYPSKPTYLEVMDPKGSKSNAVQFLIQRMGIDRKDIIAMGDNYNDREMISFAGMGVAMGNAPDEIKAAANYITDTNNNDGVRKALEHLFRF